jgi:hypothetical protein
MIFDPRPETGGSDALWIVGEGVPGFAAGVDDGVEVRDASQAEDAPALPEPDALHWVELDTRKNLPAEAAF